MISEIHFFISALVGEKKLLLSNMRLWKKAYVRVNQAPCINKTITKEIMKWSRLRNKFLNTILKQILKK